MPPAKSARQSARSQHGASWTGEDAGSGSHIRSNKRPAEAQAVGPADAHAFGPTPWKEAVRDEATTMTWLDARDASEGRLPPGWVYCDRPRRGAGEKHDRIWGAPAPDVGGEDRRMTFRSLATALAWANSAAPSPPSLSHQMDTTEAAAARTAAMSTLHATTVDAAAKASGHEKPTAVVSKADKRVAKRETREKLLAAMFKGLPKQSGRALKPIMQLDMATGRVIRVWPSGTAAAQKLGVSPSSISMAANHRQLCAGHRCDHAHGYLWRFLKNATRAERGEYAGYYDSSDDDDADEQAGSGEEGAYKKGDKVAQAGMSEEEEQHKSQAGSSQFVHSVVSRPVEQIDPKTLEVIRQWPSVSAAGSALSLFSSNISEAARGKRVTAGKYRWRFVSDEPELASKPSSKLELASKPSSKPEKKKKPASRPAPKVEKVKAEAAPILNEDAFVTAIVCDECEGEFELDPTQVHLVPDGDWFCPSCTAAKEDAKMKAAEHMDLELVDEYNIGATKCAPGPDSSRNDLGASSPYIGARFVDDGHTWQVARIEWSAKLRCEVAYYFDVEAGDGVWEFSDLREVRE